MRGSWEAAAGPPALRLGISQPFCIPEKVPYPVVPLSSLTLQDDSSEQLPGKKWVSPCLGQKTEARQDLSSLALTERFPEQNSWIPRPQGRPGRGEKEHELSSAALAQANFWQPMLSAAPVGTVEGMQAERTGSGARWHKCFPAPVVSTLCSLRTVA